MMHLRVILMLQAVGVAFLAMPIFGASVDLRIRFGLTDEGSTVWDGQVSVAPGSVHAIEGWRFQNSDEVVAAGRWKASTRPASTHRATAWRPRRTAEQRRPSLIADNGVLVALRDVAESSVVKVATAQGDFEFKLGDVPYGQPFQALQGAVEVMRTAVGELMSAGRTDDDFPSLAMGADGTAYLAWVSFTAAFDRDTQANPKWSKDSKIETLATRPGGDRLWLRIQKNGVWQEPIPVTPAARDLYKCSAAIDGQNRVWVIWSENKSWPEQPLANFDLWARSYRDGVMSAPIKLTDHPGSDLNPVATTDATGRIWLTWQGVREDRFQILERHQTPDGTWSRERLVSSQSGNCWAPAIAARRGNTGGVAIAWDSYETGDYDVWLREIPADGTLAEPRAVANTPNYEALPSLVYDQQDRLWIGWEESGAEWGKDWGAHVMHKGIPLYRDRQVAIRVLAGGKWFEPESSFTTALPTSGLAVAKPLVAQPPEPSRIPGKKAEPLPAKAYNNLPRLACDRDGRVWLLARTCEGTFMTPPGSVWQTYIAFYDGRKWVGPTILPHSDNLNYNLPAVSSHPSGGLLIAHSTDHRLNRHITLDASLLGVVSLEATSDPFVNDVYVSRLEFPAAPIVPSLKPIASAPTAKKAPTAETLKERSEVARARGYRTRYGSDELRIVRGEFHRHTDISSDGGEDGTLEDMWRYGLDVASMDWMGCADHENGLGREYPWWLIEKTTDAYRIPGRFEPPFGYERSVGYPEGHRNLVFAQRGIRTLPRLPRTLPEKVERAPDTLMLYEYLRRFAGVCASHTSATGAGTDWRDHDSRVETMVEIYQGARQNYERPGAPRAPEPNDVIGGWFPLGFVSAALLKGHRLAFTASSDHHSTHVSYTMAYVRDNSREALLDAMRRRHVYAATDNIIAEMRSSANGKEYLLGDEFASPTPPELRLKLIGTAPFKKITLIKDDQEVHVVTPNQSEVDLTWRDPKPIAGKTSYYYFRGEQIDDEIVWVTPMWIKYEPAK